MISSSETGRDSVFGVAGAATAGAALSRGLSSGSASGLWDGGSVGTVGFAAAGLDSTVAGFSTTEVRMAGFAGEGSPGSSDWGTGGTGLAGDFATLERTDEGWVDKGAAGETNAGATAAAGGGMGVAGAISVLASSTLLGFESAGLSANPPTLDTAGLLSATNFSIPAGSTIEFPNACGWGRGNGAATLGAGFGDGLGALAGGRLLTSVADTGSAEAALGGVAGSGAAAGVGTCAQGGDRDGSLPERTRVASFWPGRTSLEGRFFAITGLPLTALFWWLTQG